MSTAKYIETMPTLLERAQTALGDRYRLDRELGRGGMATVVLTEDLKHQRPVALKILHPDIASNIGADRFRREIDFAARLNHPHILPLIDSGEDGDLLWYAMPYVEGESLRQRLERQGRLSLAEASEIARQAAAALDYAHHHGVLHRDIKPENLLLAHDHVWVADFGIARALRRSESTEGTGIFVIGTPAYMSPEQGRGDEDLDGRSDLYALATVIYEALTGTAPFKGDTPGKIFRRREMSPPPPLRSVRADLPAAAETAIHRALALDPHDRQATAGAFAAELAGAVTSPQVARAARRASWRTLAVAGLALAAVGLSYRFLSRPPAYDDRRILILPPEGLPDVVAGFGADYATTLEYYLTQTGQLLPRRAAEAATGDVPLAEAVIAGLRRSTRSRYVVRTRISQDDSLRLYVTLHDAATLLPSSYSYERTLALGASAGPASLAVVVAMLPRLLPTGGTFDPALVRSRVIGALTSYLIGERAYRSGQFALADTMFSMALEADSTFGWAALRAAQAASWGSDRDRAIAMIERGEPYLAVLGPRVVAFAAGLKAYQEAMADSAVSSLRQALADDPQWAEAWMALGEVYHHLLPSDGQPIRRAVEAFDSARHYDPAFSAPLFHQVQYAVWQRRQADVDSLVPLLESSWREAEGRDREMVARAGLMRAACFPPGARAWATYAREHVRDTTVLKQRLSWELEAALDLAGSGLEQAQCARDGLGYVIATDTTSSDRLYALTALAHVQAAQGNADSAAILLNRPEFGLYGYRDPLAFMFAIAGLPTVDLADSAALAAAPAGTWDATAAVTRGRIRNVWALGTWQIRNGRLESAAEAENILRRIAAARDSMVPADARRLAGLFSRSLLARRLLASGDTANATVILEGLVPNAAQRQLRWQPWEALAWERYQLALLYEADGQWRRAFNLAESFDSPASYGLLLYLPQSLELRIRLAGRLGNSAYQRRLEERLAALRSGS